MARQKWKVVGPTAIEGHAPGSVFNHDFGVHEDFLVDAGHIQKARKDAKPGEGEPLDDPALVPTEEAEG